MLSIHSARTTRTCDQVDRRDFLRIGALGLGELVETGKPIRELIG